MSIEQINESSGADTYRFFFAAIDEMEAGHQLWRKSRCEAFLKALKTSARNLARALLAAKGCTISTEMPVTDQLRDINNPSNASKAVYDSIDCVLSFETGTEITKDDLRGTYKTYQSALVSTREILAHELGYKKTLFTRTVLNQIAAAVVAISLLILLSTAVYYFVQPMAIYDLDGQIFWKNKPGVPFSPENSGRFSVIANNQSREYSVNLNETQNIFLLRLDPVNKHYLTEIEIESISLLGPDNKVLRKLVLDNSMYWSCDNCILLENKSSTYRLRPAGNDPYLTSSRINVNGVKSLSIKMRAVSKKTFWEWVLGIDKSMEF